ncbi:MAG: PQQ-binding-like beta-propeller repeat protein [Fimbriiglobus sp.]
MRLRWSLFSLCLLGLSAASAADWPQWRGPNRDGKSADTKLMVGFPEGGPELAWSVTAEINEIGTGYGSVSVVGDKVFMLGADGAKNGASEFVTCLHAKTGKRIWQTPVKTGPGKLLDGWGAGPRSTPTVDADHLYVLGAMGDLTCLATKDGMEVWHVNLVEKYGGGIPTWGYSESPLVDGDKVVVTPGNKNGMVALNKKTGKLIWATSALNDGAGYAGIIPAKIKGEKQYITQTMQNAVGVDADSGELLWKTGKIGRKTAVIPTPIVTGDKAFFTAGYGAGCELIDLSGDKAKVVYNNTMIANHHGGVIEHEGKLYGHSDGKAQWFCYDYLKGGEDLIWQSKNLGKGSISFADGQFYCFSEDQGTLVTIKASDKDWTETGRFNIPSKSTVRPGRGKVWAHPVIANGKLYLRDYDKLFVYNIAK